MKRKKLMFKVEDEEKNQNFTGNFQVGHDREGNFTNLK